MLITIAAPVSAGVAIPGEAQRTVPPEAKPTPVPPPAQTPIPPTDSMQLRFYIADALYRWTVAARGVDTLIPAA